MLRTVVVGLGFVEEWTTGRSRVKTFVQRVELVRDREDGGAVKVRLDFGASEILYRLFSIITSNVWCVHPYLLPNNGKE